MYTSIFSFCWHHYIHKKKQEKNIWKITKRKQIIYAVVAMVEMLGFFIVLCLGREASL